MIIRETRYETGTGRINTATSYLPTDGDEENCQVIDVNVYNLTESVVTNVSVSLYTSIQNSSETDSGSEYSCPKVNVEEREHGDVTMPKDNYIESVNMRFDSRGSKHELFVYIFGNTDSLHLSLV